MMVNYEKPFEEYSLGIVLNGSLVATVTILCIAIKINQAAVNFGMISIVGVRIAVTFLIFHLIET